MTKNKTTSLLVSLLIGIIGFFVYSQSAEAPKYLPAPQDTTQKTTDNLSEEAKSYIEYSSEAYANAVDKRRVLFFYASWCTTCKPANADFLQSSNQVPSDVVVFKVNYNDPDTDSAEKELAKKYGITYQHTFVQVDNKGELVTKWNGGGVRDLLKNLK